MLNLQKDPLTDPSVRSILENAKNRVFAISLVYEQLHHGDNLAAQLDGESKISNEEGAVVEVTRRITEQQAGENG
jgi:two-component sensor histidine kinase